MSNRRSFFYVYSPLLPLGLTVVGIYTMATFIGLGLRVHP
jgi:hypothetical protein